MITKKISGDSKSDQSKRISAHEYQRITTEAGSGLLAMDSRVDRAGRDFHVMLTVNVDSGVFHLFKVICGEQGCRVTRHSSRAEAEQQRRRYLAASRECEAA